MVISEANASQGRRAVIIGLCFLVAILEGYDIQAMGIAAGGIGATLGLLPDRADLLGYTFSAATFGLAVGAVFGGWISDRIGRKPVLVASVAAFGVFTLATAHSVDFWTLFLARLCTGLGFGAAMPNLIAMASEISSRGRITTSVAIMFGGMPMGGVAVSLLATYLPPGENWRLLFYVGGILPIVIAPLLIYGLPETRRRPAESGHEATPEKGRVFSALFGPGRRLISISLWIAFILTLAQLYILLNWLPTLIENAGLGAALGTTGALMLNVGSIVGAFLVGLMCDKWGVRRPMLFVYGLMILSMLALTQVSGFWSVVVVCAVAGFAVVGAQFALYGLAPQFYPPAIRGTSAGAAVAAGRVGSVVGPAVAGILLGMGLTAGQVVLATVPSIAVGGLAVLALTFFGAAHLSRESGGEPQDLGQTQPQEHPA